MSNYDYLADLEFAGGDIRVVAPGCTWSAGLGVGLGRPAGSFVFVAPSDLTDGAALRALTTVASWFDALSPSDQSNVVNLLPPVGTRLRARAEAKLVAHGVVL